jgi:membrane fusion protein (multidrug efflux system)
VTDGNTIALKSITPGRDFGNNIEVIAGLKGDESVVINPPESLTEGQKVRLAEPKPAAQVKQ